MFIDCPYCGFLVALGDDGKPLPRCPNCAQRLREEDGPDLADASPMQPGGMADTMPATPATIDTVARGIDIENAPPAATAPSPPGDAGMGMATEPVEEAAASAWAPLDAPLAPGPAAQANDGPASDPVPPVAHGHAAIQSTAQPPVSPAAEGPVAPLAPSSAEAREDDAPAAPTATDAIAIAGPVAHRAETPRAHVPGDIPGSEAADPPPTEAHQDPASPAQVPDEPLSATPAGTPPATDPPPSAAADPTGAVIAPDAPPVADNRRDDPASLPPGAATTPGTGAETPGPHPDPRASDAHVTSQVDDAATVEAEAEAAPGDAASTVTVLPARPRGPRASTLPSFARAAAPARDRRRMRWEAAAIAALCLLLALQLLLSQRAPLAADARWRPLLSSLCGVLRCNLPPWRQADAFRVLERDVRAQAPGVLRVSARIRNDARWSQPWPTLRLTLSDADGRVVAARVFQPREYLGGAPTQPQLGSGQSAALRMDIVEPGPHAVAFTFDFQ